MYFHQKPHFEQNFIFSKILLVLAHFFSQEIFCYPPENHAFGKISSKIVWGRKGDSSKQCGSAHNQENAVLTMFECHYSNLKLEVVIYVYCFVTQHDHVLAHWGPPENQRFYHFAPPGPPKTPTDGTPQDTPEGVRGPVYVYTYICSYRARGAV